MRLIFISLLLCSQAPKPAVYGLGGGGGGGAHEIASVFSNSAVCEDR